MRRENGRETGGERGKERERESMRQAFHAKTQKVRGREAKVTGSVYRLESLSQPRFPCQCPLLLPVSAVSSGDEGAGRYQRRHSCRKGLRVRLQSLSHLENRRQGAQHVKKSVAHMFSQTDRRTEGEREGCRSRGGCCRIIAFHPPFSAEKEAQKQEKPGSAPVFLAFAGQTYISCLIPHQFSFRLRLSLRCIPTWIKRKED